MSRFVLIIGLLLILLIIAGVIWFIVAVKRKPQREAHRRERQAEQETAALAARAVEITRWEEAYALAHDGQRPPAGVMPPISALSTTPKTNTMAILSLVFSLIALSVLGVIFGHIALKQIADRGESGRGLAIAGLVVGYLSIVLSIVGGILLVIALWVTT